MTLSLRTPWVIPKLGTLFNMTSVEMLNSAMILEINSRVILLSWNAGCTFLVGESFSEVLEMEKKAGGFSTGRYQRDFAWHRSMIRDIVDFLREDFKYYFADFVRKGGGEYPPYP